MIEPVEKSVEVPLSAIRAFGTFTRAFPTWWPMRHLSVAALRGQDPDCVWFEEREGGRIYEFLPGGTRVDWGQVLRFRPGEAVALLWYPGASPTVATQVSVEFEALAAMRTAVRLVHSGWDAIGPGAAAARARYDREWEHALGECYVAACRGLIPED